MNDRIAGLLKQIDFYVKDEAEAHRDYQVLARVIEEVAGIGAETVRNMSDQEGSHLNELMLLKRRILEKFE